MPKIKRLDTVLGQVLPCQSDPISIVFITRGIIFIFGNCITDEHHVAKEIFPIQFRLSISSIYLPSTMTVYYFRHILLCLYTHEL